ncbi:GGDEF domain-containing protein [Arsenicicoccus piscis]|nr:GGDEF domain-containing protein [Arsenicicoccus piscis]MCH8628292.1 GGDEF domain-containing protein [Arsenicicoccus piscis]
MEHTTTTALRLEPDRDADSLALSETAWGRRVGAGGEARELAERASELAVASGDCFAQAAAAVVLARLAFKAEDFGEGLQLVVPALTRLEDYRTSGWLGRAHGVLAGAFAILGQRERCLEHHLHARTIGEHVGDLELQATAVHNLALAMPAGADQVAAFQRAEELFEQCAAVDPQAQAALAFARFNLLFARFELGETEQVAELLPEALAEARRLHLDDLVLLVVSLQARTLAAQGATAPAVEAALHALAQAREQRRTLFGDLVCDVAPMLIEGGRAGEAIPLLREAIVEAGDNQERRLRAYDSLARAYAAEGDHGSAYQALVAFDRIDTDLNSESASRRMDAMRTFHRTWAAEHEAAEQRRLSASLTDEVGRLLAVQHEVQELSSRDELTGIHNRRFFMAELARRAGRQVLGTSLTSVVVIDVDRFKRVNDGHGHAVGDRVLAEVARLLADTVRAGDLLCRYGGEEFAVIQSHPDRRSAWRAAERLRTAVEEHDWSVFGLNDDLTVSLGLAARFTPTVPEALLASADAALYEAKRRGRNQVCDGSDVPQAC